jgi:hypothetical protein
MTALRHRPTLVAALPPDETEAAALLITKVRKPEQVRADTINIHPDYQRTLDVKHAQKMADDFDPDLLLPVLLSRRADGSVWAMGGQHRVYTIVSILGWGDQLMDADVYEGLTLVEEAKIHRATAAAKAHSTLELFRVRVDAKEPMALDIRDILDQCGLHVATTGGSIPGGVRAVQALDEMYHNLGAAHLKRVLTFAVQAFEGNPFSLKASNLRGISAFLVRYGDNNDYNQNEMIERLTKVGIEQVEQQAVGIRNFAIAKPISSYTAFGRALLHFYNLKRRTRSLGEWQDNVSLPENDARRNANLVRYQAQNKQRPATVAPKGRGGK